MPATTPPARLWCREFRIGLTSSGEKAAYGINGKRGIRDGRDRCRRHQKTQKTGNYRGPRSMPQASKHAENAELQKTEIDAAGISKRSKSGMEPHRAALPDPSFFRVFCVFRRPPYPLHLTASSNTQKGPATLCRSIRQAIPEASEKSVRLRGCRFRSGRAARSGR